MKNKKEKLKGMEKSELNKKLEVLEESARVLKFKAEGSKSKNVKELMGLRKQMARILTEINQSKHENKNTTRK